MKKITFLLLIVFMMSISYGNNYTTAEKVKILKQFQEFQKSVEKENKSKILNYIAFPAEMNFKKITKKDFLEHYDNADGYYNLKYLDKINIDSQSFENTFVYNEEINEDSYKFNLEMYAKFISKENIEDSDFYKLISTKDEVFLVSVYKYVDEVSSGVYYIFGLQNNKLKLIEIVPQIEYSML